MPVRRPSSVRRPTRHHLRLPCQVVRERDFTLVADRCFDLSEEGLFVPTLSTVLTGEDLLVSFMAPFSRSFVDAEVRVARVIHGRRRGDRGRALGLSFTEMDDTCRMVLQKQLAGMPAPLPARFG